MRSLFLIPVLLLSGCVSMGYHQRAMNEAKDAEHNRLINFMRQVKEEKITIDDALYLSQYTNEKVVE